MLLAGMLPFLGYIGGKLPEGEAARLALQGAFPA
jgi:hypothetical protein